MKKIVIPMLVIVLAIGSAFTSKSSSQSINGYKQNLGSCDAVTNVPDNCTLTTGTACAFYFNQGSGGTCADQRFHN